MFRKTLARLAAVTLGGTLLLAAGTGCEVYGPGFAVGPAPLVVGPYYGPYYRPYGYYGYRYGYYGGWHRGYWR